MDKGSTTGRKIEANVTEWVCLMRMRTSYGILAAKDEDSWQIHGFRSRQEGLAYFESSYSRAASRGYEGLMSATMNWLFFQPSICQLDLSQIEAMIEERTVRHARNVAGSIRYIPLTDAAAVVWEAGSKPRLVPA